MEKISISILFVMLAAAVMAVPARRMTQTITLEDGTTMEAQLVGDEFGHWLVDSNNVHYTANADGTYRMLEATEFAAKKAASDRKRQIRNEQYTGASIRRAKANQNSNHAPALNIAPRGLLILANFSDVAFKESNSRAEMDSMLNAVNYSYDLAIGSARKYFYDQSGGLYNPQFDVVGPVTLPQPMAYYGQNLETGDDRDGDDAMIGDFVLHACSIASQLPGVDFSIYDNDGDEYVDFVYIIYAGYGEADGGGDNTLWPASFDLPSAIYWGYSSLGSDAYWNTDNYTFDGVGVGAFAYSSELSYYNSVRNPTRGFTRTNPMRNGIGTFCHEFSHVIGLPDYYDTEYGTNYSSNLTPGLWSLMDGGSYNEDGEVPPSYSIYDKYFVGWATPTLLNNPQDVSLTADGFSGCYITSDGSAATPTDRRTVYYLENRQQSGWDIGLPGHGMMVWKAQYDEDKWYNNVVNNTDNSPNVTYMPADGRYSYSQGDDGDPYPGRNSVRNYSPYAAYPLTEITESRGIVSFKFMGGDRNRGFSVSFNGGKAILTADSTERIMEGHAWSGTVSAQDLYKLTSVTVSMGGETVDNAVSFAADSLTAVVQIGQVTGDITISATTRRIRRQGEGNACDEYYWEAQSALEEGENLLDVMTWTLSVGARTPFLSYESAKGAQFGSGNKPAQQVSLTTDDAAECTADEIIVNAATGSGGDATLSVYINDRQIGNTQQLGWSSADYVFKNTGNQQGRIEIRMVNTMKSLFLKSIDILFKEAGEPVSAVEETDAHRATKTIRNGQIYIMRDNILYDILGNIVSK